MCRCGTKEWDMVGQIVGWTCWSWRSFPTWFSDSNVHLLLVIQAPGASFAVLSPQSFSPRWVPMVRDPSTKLLTFDDRYLSSCPGFMIKCPHSHSAGAPSLSLRCHEDLLGTDSREKRFLTFHALLSCFLTLLEVEKMSAINFLYFTCFQRRGCIKGQKTKLETLSCFFFFFCFLWNILYLKQNLEQELVLKIDKIMTSNHDSLQAHIRCENNLSAIALWTCDFFLCAIDLKLPDLEHLLALF